jgi:CubicO group peptidase (beta-lactamase class C family)
MEALQLTASWPVASVAAACVRPNGSMDTVGDPGHVFRLASISKTITSWAVLVAVEEGITELDAPAGQPGCTLRHLLAHAGGYAFDGDTPIARPGTRRTYSNTGIELAAAHIAAAAAMPFADYVREAVFEPLRMNTTELRGSPAHGMWSTLADQLQWVAELRRPRLIAPATAAAATSVQFPELRGVVPGFGRYDPCPWGLGVEIRGEKWPHWTGRRNSPATFGHFGGAGTVLWVDPEVDVACVALTDRAFDEWAGDARRLWPELADAVLTEVAG